MRSAIAIHSIENHSHHKLQSTTKMHRTSLKRLLTRFSTKTWLLIIAIIIFLHAVFMSVVHIRHFPPLSESMGILEEGSPLHVISAYPRVPTMANVLLFGGRGSGVDVVSLVGYLVEI
jgi:hypothetical protein